VLSPVRRFTSPRRMMRMGLSEDIWTASTVFEYGRVYSARKRLAPPEKAAANRMIKADFDLRYWRGMCLVGEKNKRP
jgi:hypothetical protein